MTFATYYVKPRLIQSASPIIVGLVLSLMLISSAVCMEKGNSAVHSNKEHPHYNSELGRTPYQPGPMLQYPATPTDPDGPYGFNMWDAGVDRPTYYEYVDEIKISFYLSKNFTKEEKRVFKRMDRLLIDVIKELNHWVGGRLKHKRFRSKLFDRELLRSKREIGIYFKHESRYFAYASPFYIVDPRGVAYAGGVVSLGGGSIFNTWSQLVTRYFNDSDLSARKRIYEVLIHEICHNLGLAHFPSKFNGERQLMYPSVSFSYDNHSVKDLLKDGDKAGLLSIAGFSANARECAKGICKKIWKRGRVVWPSDPPSHEFDLNPDESNFAIGYPETFDIFEEIENIER